MHRKMVKSDLKSGLISGGHIRPGPDMAGYENLAGFRPGPDMISGATLLGVGQNISLVYHFHSQWLRWRTGSTATHQLFNL